MVSVFIYTCIKMLRHTYRMKILKLIKILHSFQDGCIYPENRCPSAPFQEPFQEPEDDLFRVLRILLEKEDQQNKDDQIRRQES